METLSTRFPKQLGVIRGSPQLPTLFSTSAAWERFGSRDFGEEVTDRRSSWVRRLRTDAGDWHVKTYEYATWNDRLRGLCRTTGPFVRSRAAREFDALSWLGQNAPPAAEAVGVFETRRLGLLRRAILVTATVPGEPLDRWLPQCVDNHERQTVAEALGRYIGRLHRLGFRCGNLDLRNLIAHRTETGRWQITLIDSPRYRLRQAGRQPDAHSEADWRRLLPQLLPFGLEAPARRAANEIDEPD